ncbi:hypothetical protein NOR53_1338 [gamma proteobacterium NOR5-3]|nr:hypothetical protein NOR53_1338 [gamma proteobacterium NOR5-3]
MHESETVTQGVDEHVKMLKLNERLHVKMRAINPCTLPQRRVRNQ